jgi:putative peptidoglycan lipid II flippase
MTTPGSDQRILASSAVMAAGTVVSRASGFVRSALLVLALGAVLRADLFSIANTIPNMVYILVAGGVFNAVLVPQLVRRIKDDPDGGDAYASRIITLSALFLAAVTVVLMVLAPVLLRLYLDDDFLEPALAPHLESIVDLTRWCLPQVFFYGMYVLVGQVLNARGRFGPMMWAPIANNVISVAMLVAYLLAFGAATVAQTGDALSSSQEALLGLGSTLGIAAQLVVLVPYLRASGFTYRPRFDFRDPELKKTLSLGVWTVLFVVATQLAYMYVVKLASGGSAAGGTGYTIYSTGLLLMMVPHSVVTVSLATAILPRISSLAHDGDLRGVGRTVGSTLGTALALVLPFAVLLPVVADDVANGLFGWGATDPEQLAPTIALFGPALVPFTVHYLMQRGFYSLEATRRVFYIQCAVALTNVVAAHLLVASRPPVDTAPMLVVANLLSYLVGSIISFTVLRRTLGELQGAQLMRFAVRISLVLAAAAAAAWGVEWALSGLGDEPHPLVALGRGGAAGALGLLVVLGGAKVLRIREVTSMVDTVAARLRRG